MKVGYCNGNDEGSDHQKEEHVETPELGKNTKLTPDTNPIHECYGCQYCLAMLLDEGDTEMNYEAVLRSLDVDPSVLPEAPSNTGKELARAIERRTQDEIHDCLLCGQPAKTALVLNRKDGNRWLDLCPDDYSNVTVANGPGEGPVL